MDQEWQKFLVNEMSKTYMENLINHIKQDRLTKNVFPAPDKVFEAFNLCPYYNTCVVIFDFAPDPRPNTNHGLAYSSLLPRDQRLPQLDRIFAEASRRPPHEREEFYPHNNLSYWAKQGILLLNVLGTCIENDRYAHAKIGWTEFIKNVVEFLNNHPNRLVFMLWSDQIINLVKPLVNQNRHLVLESGHPALELKDWVYNFHFVQATLFSIYESRREPGEDPRRIRDTEDLPINQCGPRIDWII
jgi:uracil-DNA glycosylase